MAQVLVDRSGNGPNTEGLTMNCPHCSSTIKFTYDDWQSEGHHSHEPEAVRGYISNYVRCPVCQKPLMFGSSLVGYSAPRSWERKLAREESGH
jgi:hypothetical protein